MQNNTDKAEQKTAGASKNRAIKCVHCGVMVGVGDTHRHKTAGVEPESPTWTDQARNAIRQGQDLNEFILHCHPDSRKEARKAYMRLIVASVNHAGKLAEALTIAQSAFTHSSDGVIRFTDCERSQIRSALAQYRSLTSYDAELNTSPPASASEDIAKAEVPA